MMRSMLCGVAALLLFVGGANADTVFGKVVKIDDKKITVKVEDAEKTYDIAKDVKVVRPGKKNVLIDEKGGVSAVKADDDTKLTVEKQDGKDTVTQIELAKKKKKKKDK
jgi:hypothetical protein